MDNTITKENSTRDSWNHIVKQYCNHYNCSESTVQRDWELILSEIFGYKSCKDELRTQFSKKIGSRERIIPDILVSKDNNDLFIAELKQYNFKFGQGSEEQLISYFNQLHISIGFLVCEKLYLYSYNYAEKLINKVEIPFTKDNPNGMKFVELFSKENYNENAIKEFIKEQSDFITCPKSHKTHINKADNLYNECKNDVYFTNRILKVGDYITANTHAQFLNILLGKNYKGWMRSTYNLIKDIYFIHFAFEENEVAGWENTYDSTGKFFCETYYGSPDNWLKSWDELPSPYRAMFKIENNGFTRRYIFMGIYEMQDDAIPSRRAHKRIKDTESFPDYKFCPDNKT